MDKKNIKKLIIFTFLILMFFILLSADNYNKDVKKLKKLALSRYYTKNIKVLIDMEKEGYRNYQIYFLLAYNYIQIGDRTTALVYLRKGLFYNKRNKLLLSYVKKLEPEYYKDITYFPFFINISFNIYFILLIISNLIIFLSMIFKKRELMKLFIFTSFILYLAFIINLIYPYFDKSAFTLRQCNVYKYPSLNSSILTDIKNAMPLKIKLIGTNFNYVILTNGIEGWILKKDIRKVFYDKRK